MFEYFFVKVAKAQSEPIKQAADNFAAGSPDVDSLVQILLNLASWFLIFVGIIAVIFILYAGFKIITAGGGSEEKVKEAKKMLIWSIVGLAIAILSFSIVTFTSSLLNSSSSGGGSGGNVPTGGTCLLDSDCQSGSCSAPPGTGAGICL